MEHNLHLDSKTSKPVYNLHDQVLRDEPYRHKFILLPDKRTVVLEVIAKEARDQRRLTFYTFPPWPGRYSKDMIEPYGFPPKFNVYKDEDGKEGAELMIIFPLPNDPSNRCRKYRTLIWVNGNSVIRCLNNEGERVALPPQLVYDMVCPFEQPAFEECAAWLKQHFGL
jgi:hypothetical protein